MVGVLGSRTGILIWLWPCSDRIEHRHEVGAPFGRAVERAIGVDGRIAPVGRRSRRADRPWASTSPRRVTTILRSTPCGRCGLADGSSPAAIRSVQSPNSFKRALGVETVDDCGPCCVARLAGLDAPRPRFAPTSRTCRAPSGSCASPCCRAGGSSTQPSVLMPCEPLRLALHVRSGCRCRSVAGAGKLALVRNLRACENQ